MTHFLTRADAMDDQDRRNEAAEEARERRLAAEADPDVSHMCAAGAALTDRAVAFLGPLIEPCDNCDAPSGQECRPPCIGYPVSAADYDALVGCLDCGAGRDEHCRHGCPRYIDL